MGSNPKNIVHNICQFVNSQQPQPLRVSHVSCFVNPQLKACFHDFLRYDPVRRPLQPPYVGPCQLLSRGDKAFKAVFNGREETVPIDCLKAATIETTQSLAFGQPTVSSPVSSSSRDWITVHLTAIASPKSAIANTAPKQTTSSGRRVGSISYHQ